MNVHFYHISCSSILLCSKRINVIPTKGTAIKLNGYYYIVERVIFDVDKCEYSVFLNN